MNESEKPKLIPFEPDNLMTTDTIMEKLGISKTEANAILWDLFEKEIIDMVPVLDDEKTKQLRAKN
jgi:transcription initiation factor IIE alpha subunit